MHLKCAMAKCCRKITLDLFFKKVSAERSRAAGLRCGKLSGVAELNQVSPHAPGVGGDMGDSAASVVLSDLET